MLQSVFSLLAPHFCLVCNREGSVLCAECLLTNLPTLEPCCAGCVRPSPGFKICAACRPRIGAVRVWPATAYGDVAKQLVHAMKYNYARAAAADIARLIARRLPALPPDAVIVPVPTAVARVRQRGFDHAKLIGKSLARQTRHTYYDVLRRHGKTRQVGAKRDQRAAQLAGVFWLKSPLPKDAMVVLVDDVFTTGATIGAAVNMLRSMGYTRVYAATFALTV